LERYLAMVPALRDYACFRATSEHFRKPWKEWPSDVKRMHEGLCSTLQMAQQYHMYVQWLADEQLQRAAAPADGGCGLYLDLPLGVDANGYDVWRNQTLFGLGAAGGCPPDVVFPRGQNWGFVPLHPQSIRRQGYQYIRDFLHHQMRFAKVLRIDHVASFHRVYWIPPEADASDGVYVNYPAEELYAIFALESHRHRTIVVGEDLGTVPPEVRWGMARHNVHRMYVVQNELTNDPQAALPEPPASSIASVNTHDMPPFAGYWNSTDLDERESAGLLQDELRTAEVESRNERRAALQKFLEAAGYVEPGAECGAIFEGCLAYLADSPARLLILNLEDLWQETRSQNIPSSHQSQTNWQRKASLSLEEFSADRTINELLQRFATVFNGGSV
jgi:4-alpha-glucanotransferase